MSSYQESAENEKLIAGDRQKVAEYGTIDPRLRAMLMTQRQALIMQLGALEEYLGLTRSIVPQHKRRSDHG